MQPVPEGEVKEGLRKVKEGRKEKNQSQGQYAGESAASPLLRSHPRESFPASLHSGSLHTVKDTHMISRAAPATRSVGATLAP